jgi:ParB/RepB/Spo0J family partition protein
MELPISSIKVGPRHRKNLGDIEALARSIADVGLLHPIVITPERELIAGQRRLEAYRQLGLAEIPVTVVSLSDIVRGEYAENTFREPFLPSEAVEIAKALEPKEQESARERERAGVPSEKFSQGRALDKTAAAVGVSRPTLVKAKAVVEAAEAEPERFGNLVELMDDTGRVDRAFRELKRARRDESPPPPPPCGEYSVIYADPPWRYEFSETNSREVENQYPTMTLEDIQHLPIPAAKDCVLFLWATSPKLAEAMTVIDMWGFTYRTCGVWIKPSIGMGYYLRQRHELLLIATLGKPGVPDSSDRFDSVIEAPRSKHSEKPPIVYEMIETMYPHATRIELFCRTPRDGWAVWGRDAGTTTQGA